MRTRAWLMATILSIVISAGALCSAANADYPCGCLELDSGGRLTVGFTQAPVPTMTSKFEFGLGQPGFAVSTWGQVAGLSAPSVSAGAKATLVRDWLSLSVLLDKPAATLGMSVAAEVTSPSWLLVYANPSIAAAVAGRIVTPILGSRVPPEISVSPSITVIAPLLDSLLSCALSADLQLDPGAASIRLPGMAIAVSYSLGPAALSGSLGFTGLMTSLASARLTVGIPDWGLEFSANLTPSGFGDLFYSVAVSLQWGGSYLLPPKASEEGNSSCPGGICY